VLLYSLTSKSDPVLQFGRRNLPDALKEPRVFWIRRKPRWRAMYLLAALNTLVWR